MTAATGTVVDARDGKVYKTVLMPDDKWWSAENLAWAGAGVAYNNDPANCAIYGRLYTWAEAIASCPAGTHLPSDAEWTALTDAIPDPDGTKLKANSPLWSTNTGTDDYGFRALPGGYGYGTHFYYVGDYVYWWGATEDDAQNAWDRLIYYNFANVFRDYNDKATGLSVRFIVDSGNIVDTAPTPRIYPASGTLQGVQFVTIKGQGTVRYTLDGSEPSASSPIYTGPIRLSSPTTVKARAYVAPLESLTATATLDIQGATLRAIPSYRGHVMPYLLEQYKGDNP